MPQRIAFATFWDFMDKSADGGTKCFFCIEI